MKEQSTTGYPPVKSPVSLQQLVDNLVNNCLPLAQNNCSAIVNEIGQGVSLQKNSEQFIALIDEVITMVIANSKKGDIHISAEKRDEQLVLAIQERNNYNGYALSFSIGTLMEDAYSMGGQLDISSPCKKITTIYLSLPGRSAA